MMVPLIFLSQIFSYCDLPQYFSKTVFFFYKITLKWDPIYSIPPNAEYLPKIFCQIGFLKQYFSSQNLSHGVPPKWNSSPKDSCISKGIHILLKILIYHHPPYKLVFSLSNCDLHNLKMAKHHFCKLSCL